jgi:HEAT repeat protein
MSYVRTHTIRTWTRFARLAVFSWAVACLLGAGAGPSLASGRPTQANRLVQTSPASSEAAMKGINEGRELVKGAQWDRAAAKFEEVISRYPDSGRVDAALYWYAYALAKKGTNDGAYETLERLMRDYPKSEWVDDARALRAEIAPRIRKEVQVDVDDPKEDCEIKIIALRSLFDSNPERAVTLTTDILRPTSKAPECLQNGAVMLLGQSGGPRARAMLIEFVRNGQNPELRKSALMAIAHSGGGSGFDDGLYALLREMALGADEEMAKAALFVFSQDDSPRGSQLLVELATSAASIEVRKQAVFWLGQREGALDELLKIYTAATEPEIQKQALFAISQNDDARAEQLLLQIARTGGEAELRKQAIFFLSQREGCGAVDTLSQVYDTEKDDEVKKQVLFALGQNECKPALLRLIRVAREDPSTEMRKQAIFWIGQRDDPEAQKFLEELLK